MLPFYDDKDDKDMIYVVHLLKLLSIQYDVRPKIRDTFWINKLKNPKIWETIEGVIEYAVEEIEENDYSPFDQPIQCSSSEQTAIRRSRSAPRSSGNQIIISWLITLSILDFRELEIAQIKN